jgi:hypothetical protein
MFTQLKHNKLIADMPGGQEERGWEIDDWGPCSAVWDIFLPSALILGVLYIVKLIGYILTPCLCSRSST